MEGSNPGGSKAGAADNLSDKVCGIASGKKTLPLSSDYSSLSASSLYVDKTLILRDIIDTTSPGTVYLFTRPRRFGKTMIATMLKSFFEDPTTCTDSELSDTSGLFTDRKIWSCGEKYRNEQGKYAVIYLDFSSVKAKTWKGAYSHINAVLSEEIDRHNQIFNCSKCDQNALRKLKKIADEKAEESVTEQTLKLLSRTLKQCTGKGSIIIIDEYDTAILQSQLNGYYEEACDFLSSFFSYGLKNNFCLQYGFLTGILRVVLAGFFSGGNNIKVYSVLDNNYSEYFGFTEDEVREIAHLYGRDDKLSEIYEYYKGYEFGNTCIFNPWSVNNYFIGGCTSRAYWIDTANNELLSNLIFKIGSTAYSDLLDVLNEDPDHPSVSARVTINPQVMYPDSGCNKTVLFSFLVMTGYLKARNVGKTKGKSRYVCDVSIPNKEVRSTFCGNILSYFFPVLSDENDTSSIVLEFKEALLNGNMETVLSTLNQMLLSVVSSYDLVSENSYHLFLAGICTGIENYHLTRESGNGRCDLVLRPKDLTQPGIILELKHLKEPKKRKGSDLERELHDLAQEAMDQISQNHYSTELVDAGVKTIYSYGMAFYKKQVQIVFQETSV